MNSIQNQSNVQTESGMTTSCLQPVANLPASLVSILNTGNSSYLHWYQNPKPIKFKPYHTACNLKLFEFFRKSITDNSGKYFKFTKTHRQPLMAILCHLQLSARTNRPVEISITDKRPLKNIIYALERMGMIDFKIGYSDVTANHSHLSKYRPTDKFRETLCSAKCTLKDIEQVRVVNIKDENGKTVDRINLDGTTQDGKCIKLFNDFIKQHEIQCDIQPDDFDQNDHLYGLKGIISLNSQVARIYTGEEGIGGFIRNGQV